MSADVLESVAALERITFDGDCGYYWVEALNDKSVTDWLSSVTTGMPIEDELQEAANDCLTIYLNEGFYQSQRFVETYARVTATNALLADLLDFGVNDWQSGYRWFDPRLGFEKWAQSMFVAVNAIISAPFYNSDWIGVSESISLLGSQGASIHSVDVVLSLRKLTDKWLFDYGLQNPVCVEDCISWRLLAELAQIRAIVSGIPYRLPVPPGDWLTLRTASDETQEQRIKAMADLYRRIQTKGQIAPDSLVGKDQAGILHLRVLQRLGLYKGYIRKPNSQMEKRTDLTIKSLNLTAESIKNYVL